jgi:hypothetical protein
MDMDMETTATRAERDGRPLFGLFSDLWRETSTLVHDEVALAKAEISEKASRAGSGAAAIAAGGAVLFAGFLMLLFAAAAALEQVLPPDNAAWLAPLIVGIVVLIVGYIAVSAGRRRLRADSLKPTYTLESLRRNGQLVKEHVR